MRIFLQYGTLAAILLNTAIAEAGWSVEVEEAAFGKTEARAITDVKGASALFFECVDDELSFGMVILSRNDEGQQAGTGTMRVMVDEPPHEDYDVDIGSTVGGQLRLTSRNPDEAEKLAFKIMAAKKSVDTAVLQADGGLWLPTKRSSKGAKNSISKVLKACKIDIPQPPALGTIINIDATSKMPWVTLCMYDKKPGQGCNCELIDQGSCRYTGEINRSK